MRILLAASEAVPFAKTGGLADVLGALPRALAALGHEVVLVLPLHAAIDRTKHNPKGSSLAYGHPFAATGARILGLTAKELATEMKGRALISVCTAGGQGVAAIVERAA